VGTIATIGEFRAMLPVEPWKRASPKVKMPPSDATSQYPRPVGVVAMSTIGRLSGRAPCEPRKGASPNAKIPPSAAASQ
jgi:hypothetical protein